MYLYLLLFFDYIFIVLCCFQGRNQVIAILLLRSLCFLGLVWFQGRLIDVFNFDCGALFECFILILFNFFKVGCASHIFYFLLIQFQQIFDQLNQGVGVLSRIRQTTKFEQQMLPMKSNSKNQNQFMTKFSVILNKFKDSSTIHVGHQQLKNFFSQFTLKEIIIPFITKMDTSEQLSDRQKREYSKVYISLIETYKDEILLDAFYEKLMESLNKKSSGVSEVIAYISKTLLNRIQDPQSLYPFVSIIINIFHNHVEIAKILKQLIEIIDSSVISNMQEDIMSILHDRINNAKLKNDYLDAILSLVLNMEEKLTVQNQVCNFLFKYLKNEDWNCRKICVDIAYAFLVINHGISQNLHSIIKQLKYDKIKHVRDSVNNYEVLYKQTYGEQVVQKTAKSQSTMRQAKIKSEQAIKKVTKSPAPVVQRQEVLSIRQRTNSQSKGKVKNQNFFKNAKNSDVIKINQDNKSSALESEHVPIDINNNFSVQIPKVKIEQPKHEGKGNFEEYLKRRNSPKNNLPIQHQSKATIKEVDKSSQKSSNVRVGDLNEVPKFNYDRQLQNFKKKNRGLEGNVEANQQFRQSSSFSPEMNRQNQQDISLSFAESKVYNSAHDELISMFRQFEKRINERLDCFDRRIQVLEGRQNSPGQSYKMEKGRILSPEVQSMQKMREESPKSLYYNETPSESKWQSSLGQNVESNLQEKVRLSIANQNWDEAFTLALTNNRKNILLNLLERCVFPTDKTVEECILLEIKKLLGYTSALKWLKYYLSEKNLSQARLIKLKQDLLRRTGGDNKNYQLMRQLVLNEINQKLNFQ